MKHMFPLSYYTGAFHDKKKENFVQSLANDIIEYLKSDVKGREEYLLAAIRRALTEEGL
jgi:hypothetical protein